MKKFTVLACLSLLFLFVGTSHASYVQGVLDPVSFYVVDDPNSPDSEQVVLDTTALFLPSGFQLEYFYSGVANWTVLQSLTTFFTGPQGIAQVLLRLYNPDTDTEDTSGELTFQGAEGPLYTSLLIDWDPTSSASLSLSTAGNDDNLAPVPVPAAIWLLGSGVFGIFAFRRKK